MEVYLEASNIPNDRRSLVGGAFLDDTAATWLRSIANNYPANWAQLRALMEAQFAPVNDARNAREELDSLKQGSRTIRQYVTDFQNISIRIPNMAAEDRLHRFISGLKRDIREIVDHRNPADLNGAIQAALTTERWNREEEKPEAMQLDKVFFNRKYGNFKSDKDTLRKEGRCYYCKEKGHLAINCPKKHLNSNAQ